MKKLALSILIIFCLVSPSFSQQEVIVVKKAEKFEYDDDLTVNNKEYFGWALTDTLTSVSRWKIMRITYTGTDFVIEWADGDQIYDNEWDNRATTVSYN